MKKYILYSIFFTCAFSLNCFSQNASFLLNEKKIVEPQTNILAINDKIFKPGQKVKYYHVEEITDVKFGGYKTTYDVSNPKFIRTYSLGPNNKRIITPIFVDAEPLEESKLKDDTLKSFLNESKLSISDTPKKANSYAYIDIIETYERMSDKGYKSVEMLKKISNAYYFNDELEKAAKSYEELFELTTNLEPEFYYRYSIALKSIGKTEKSNEMLKKFNQLSGNSTK
ncbi:hypothetical protein [Flavobacterium sp. N3904]|uniref:hypothetical protein n=1 Tax=Flavobacterium sp. N3904 TaxID=2986835 RepID=UPI002224868D|nr:hypothetical protein [Flavobacterium sp. N3904]